LVRFLIVQFCCGVLEVKIKEKRRNNVSYLMQSGDKFYPAASKEALQESS
jgi:hypothetical protein